MRECAEGGKREKRVLPGWTEAVRWVLDGVLFTGFTVQIILGLVWMCLQLGGVQDFEWAEREGTGSGGLFALCRSLFGLLGKQPPLLYLLQLGLAFSAGYVFVRRHLSGRFSGRENIRRGFCVWGSLALLTFPFSMQCHMAVLPYSVSGSLFLLMLSCLLEAAGPAAVGGRPRRLAGAGICLLLAVILSGSADSDFDGDGGVWGRGMEAAMASRFGWCDIWNDASYWPEELQAMTDDVIWETAYCPGNMEILLKTIEERAGAEAAKVYYKEIASVGWRSHKALIVRQAGWDVLGYAAIPLVFPLLMEGEGYDSCTGRNYEIMRERAPVLTGYYVYYGCWWYGCCAALALIKSLFLLAEGGVQWKRFFSAAGIIFLAAGIPVFLYTMRGAGFMDYKCTAAVSALWLAWGILCMGGSRNDKNDKGKEEL